MDLSFLQQESTISLVDKFIEDNPAPEKPRDYLGMSEIGDPCARKLWLKYNGNLKEKFEPRILRLFNLGHMIEKRILDDLLRAGFVVTDTQTAFVDFVGKFKGHCDGIILGMPESKKPHILEIKSANAKNFALFVKDGIAAHKDYGPKYMAQAQCYMGYAKLDRALFIVENKETSERYQERVRFDKAEFEQIREKAYSIIFSAFPPKGISSRPDWFQCRFCHFNMNGCRDTWPGEPAF